MPKPPEPPKDDTPDFRKIFRLAEHYSEASSLLDDQARRDQTKEEQWGCSGPKLLVDSFAVELYLKCLYVQDQNAAPPKRGADAHDWQKLFDKLKPGTQQAILVEYKRLRDEDPIVGKFLLLREIKPDALKVRDFHRALKAARNTFYKKRYLYEVETKKEGDADEEKWFYADFLRKAIRNVAISHPEIVKLIKTSG